MIPRSVRLIALTVSALALTACARTNQHRPPRPVRIAIMPFSAPESITERPYDIRGWWFGAHDVRQNRNVGGWAAESLHRHLQMMDGVEVVPHYDLRRYLLDQWRTLKQAHPDLSDDQIDALLSSVPLADYGRDLEVDKIITGQVFAATTSHNRTIDTWVAHVDYQIQIWDVDDMAAAAEMGQAEAPEYEDRVEERKWFGTWLGAADEVSRTVTERLRRRYFSDPGHFSNL